MAITLNGTTGIDTPSIVADTDTLYVDATNNRVGIGASNPSYKLEVGSTSDSSISANIKTSTSGTGNLFFSDTNNGQGGITYNHTSDYMRFLVNDAERMRIDSSGNVGIGITPSTASSSYGQKVVQFGPSGALSSISASTTNNQTQISGNITDPLGSPKYIYSDAASAFKLANGEFYWYNAPSGTAGGAATFTERMRIDSSGNLLFNTTAPAGIEKVSIVYNNSNSVGTSYRCSSGTYTWAAINFLNASSSQVGYIYPTSTSTQYSTSSDYRLKENITPMTGALSTVAQLKPCTYVWKSTGEASQGFIAHELQAVVPDCVNGEKDAVDTEGNPVYQGIDTSFLVATLTAAIQEQQAIIETLKTRIEALEQA